MWCYESECVETLCGDGIEQPEEECDDGDRDDDDGCTSECLFTCVRDDSDRDCASECNPTARCDASSHVCSEGEPLPDGTLCDRGEGYCLSGVCVELDCENGSDIPPGLCETDNPSTADAGVDETCGSEGPLSPGSHERTVDDDRTFQFYIPESLNSSQKVPLVFVHHGFTMSGEDMKTLTSWTEIADEEGIVVVFPDGGGFAPWNVGEKTVCSAGEVVNDTTQDDFGFVENMIENIDQAVCVDRTKVFVTGFSMGGYFTNNIACHRPNLVRAVAPHSGGMEIDAECADPRPVLIIHGIADPLIDYDECALLARDQWAEFNGCSTEVDTEEIKGGFCERNRDCPVDAQVEICSFEGMGHGWAGADNALYGGGSEYEDAARLIWRFFQEQMED
jgi:polyhydroxybutyrate depolymerase